MRLKLPALKNSEWSVESSAHILGLRLTTKVNGEYVHAEHRIDRYMLELGCENTAHGIVECLVRQQERAIGAAVLGRPIN
ncbi:hypothetical protein [Stenotrophomonas sp. SAU14A_NAIMI4_8]|uniref:hypothetical protein n=1 Tax=Stenotrophomonas sp. SAU14A_NAIMI4_8 TaxID=2072409 RepID=UPI000D53D30B|nr:hypothetical protein [Stenotrophomonas sp. SAU14A_NAIMI4_8]AWH32215.1 hypothetical protein C1930_04675 [Stenotrophomonas sp. SAU14A_NAIMI4_8]